MRYGFALRVLRAVRDVNQTELARAAGCGRTYVSMVERGRRRPRRAAVLRFAAALRVTPARLDELAAEHDTLAALPIERRAEIADFLLGLGSGPS